MPRPVVAGGIALFSYWTDDRGFRVLAAEPYLAHTHQASFSVELWSPVCGPDVAHVTFAAARTEPHVP